MNRKLIYGGWAVREALAEGTARQVIMARGAEGSHVDAIIDLAREKGIHIRWVPRNEVDKMVQGRHQGVVAETQGLYKAVVY